MKAYLTLAELPYRSEQLYEYLCDYKRTHNGNSPTFRQIGAAIGVDSTSLITYYLDRLEQVGKIRRPERKASGIEVIGGRWIPPSN